MLCGTVGNRVPACQSCIALRLILPHILGIDTQVHQVFSLFRPFYLPVVGATTRDIILQHEHDIKPETATSDIDDDVGLCK